MDSSIKRTIIICVTAVVCVAVIADSVKSLGRSVEISSRIMSQEMSRGMENASGKISGGLANSRSSVSIPSSLNLRLYNGSGNDQDSLKVYINK